MPLSDLEIRDKVIKHDYEFKALSDSLNKVVGELHELTQSLKNVNIIAEKLDNMDHNLKESFQRVHKRTDKLEEEVKQLKEEHHQFDKNQNQIDTLNRTVYGKEGRGGLLFDVEDIKKFMYKAMGYFTLGNILIAALIGVYFK